MCDRKKQKINDLIVFFHLTTKEARGMTLVQNGLLLDENITYEAFNSFFCFGALGQSMIGAMTRKRNAGYLLVLFTGLVNSAGEQQCVALQSSSLSDFNQNSCLMCRTQSIVE